MGAADGRSDGVLSMLPHTKALLEALQREEGFEPEVPRADVVRQPLDDPRILTLHLRKRNQTNLIRRMLQDAGYPDLARMTAFRRESLDDGENL